jgi:putative endonuclease
MNKKYRRMIGRMREKRSIARKGEPWFLYILRCKDGTLYTGITKDLDRRLKMHSEGRASRYTRTRRPVRLLYHENCRSRADALIRECKVKAFPRKKKEALSLPPLGGGR